MTSYAKTIFLRRTGFTEWTILNSKNNPLYIITPCRSQHEAEERAKVWASSWSSVNLVVENEQQK